MTRPWPLEFPDTAKRIRAIHAQRKRLAVERALCSPFMAHRLKDVDPARLEEPGEWSEIPPLTKDELRGPPSEVFYRDFRIEPREAAVEYWRSGGATPRFVDRRND